MFLNFFVWRHVRQHICDYVIFTEENVQEKTSAEWCQQSVRKVGRFLNGSCNVFSLPPGYTFSVEESGNLREGSGSSKTSSSILSSIGFILLDNLLSRDFSTETKRKTDKFSNEWAKYRLFMHSRLREIQNPDSIKISVHISQRRKNISEKWPSGIFQDHWKRRSSTVCQYREMLQ